MTYADSVNADLWFGAITTLAGAAVGGGISFILNRQQFSEERLARHESDAIERQKRSEDRRFEAYSAYLTLARSFRNLVQAYYLHADSRPQLGEIDRVLQEATDSSALVFLVVESDPTYRSCIEILGAMWKAQRRLHHIETVEGDPWTIINNEIGLATRNFQNAARSELQVAGPSDPWVMHEEHSHPDILAKEIKPGGGLQSAT